MIRNIGLFLMLLVLGCNAQNPASNEELNRRVEWYARQVYSMPSYVNARIVKRTGGSYLTGFDSLVVEFSYDGQTKNVDLLISKDNKMLLSAKHMDLTVDPAAQLMEQIDIAGRPVRGSAKAKVTMVVFDDYQCPYCSHFHTTVVDLLKTYGDRIKVVYKDFPLYTVHPWAERAAIDSQCLAMQNGDAYWAFVDTLHARSKQVTSVNGVENQQKAVDNLATELGAKHKLDAAKLSACLAQQPKDELLAAQAEADKLGVDAVPSIFINGEHIDGAVPESILRSVLDKALANAEAPAKR